MFGNLFVDEEKFKRTKPYDLEIEIQEPKSVCCGGGGNTPVRDPKQSGGVGSQCTRYKQE